jgi:hypothetical protein
LYLFCLCGLIYAIQYATDFYKAITNITSGLMLPLTTADLLAHAIVGSVLENLDMERLVREVGHAVAQRILGNNESVDDVARELHEKLLLRNESTKKVVIESIYKESEEAKHNVAVFSSATSLAEARPLLKRVSLYSNLMWKSELTFPALQVNGTRFTDKYLQARASFTRNSYYTPYGSSRSVDYGRPTASTPPPSAAGSPPHSPPRKVVSDFAAFGAPKNASVFGTAVASTPFSLAGGKAAFGGLRNGGGRGMLDADDDDEEEETSAGGQKVELREGSISLEQVRPY